MNAPRDAHGAPWRTVALASVPVLAAVIAGSLGFALGRRGTPAPAPRAAGVPIELPTGQAAGLAPIGPDSLVRLLPDGRIVLLERVEQGGAPRLRIAAVYALADEQSRHALTPASWTPHGLYLDDLGAQAEAAMTAARSSFERLAASTRVDVALNTELEGHARTMIRLGDVSFLRQQLTATSYPARRAAALALGAAGFMEAAPPLAEVMRETGEAGPRARALLKELSGRSLDSREAFDAWWRKLPVAERYRLPEGIRK
ncbi:MAG: hypothetical protein ACYTFT_06870 [Planctomycetota bacterium]